MQCPAEVLFAQRLHAHPPERAGCAARGQQAEELVAGDPPQFQHQLTDLSGAQPRLGVGGHARAAQQRPQFQPAVHRAPGDRADVGRGDEVIDHLGSTGENEGRPSR
ncbi:hypothetical protein GCM10010174_75290 [Kutzneria viridogrisea]